MELKDTESCYFMCWNWKSYENLYRNLPKDQVRGDFGDIDVYEQLKDDSNWLNKMIE